MSRLALIRQVDPGSTIASIATLPLASLPEKRDAADAMSLGVRVLAEGSL